MRIFSYVSAALVAMLLVGCDGDARPFEEAVEVRSQNLSSIAVVPPAISVPGLVMNIGETAQFGVQATSVIGQTVPLESSDRDWQVTDESVASINDDGKLVAIANGDVGVFISIGGLVSETYGLKVSDSVLTNVQTIVGESSIERCLPGDYQATGLYEDGTERDLAAVSWALATADADNARLLNNPDTTVTVTGLNPTVVTLTAAISGFSLSLPITISNTLTAIEISPTSGSVDVDDVASFAAFGKYVEADAEATALPREENVTASVDWKIDSGSTYASVSNSEDARGQVTGLSSGSATLSANCGNLASSPIVVIVNDRFDNGLSFLRDSVTMVVGNFTTLSVSTGSSYSSANSLDNDDLTWELSTDSTSSPAISLVDDGTNAGRIQALAVGGATITVTDDDGASASIRVEVTSN